jgi:hypothetical protein
MRRLRLPPLLLALALVLPALGLPSPAHAQEAASVVRLEARPARVTVTVGATAPLRVVALDADGRPVDVPVRIVGPRTAIRYQDGRVEGIEAGRYELYATAVLPSGSEGDPPRLTVPVTVDWPAVVRVEIAAADTGRLYEGTTVRYVARALHADGSERPGATVAWRSSAPDVVEVGPLGHATARASGRATLTATAEGVSGELIVDAAPLPAVSLRIEGGPEGTRVRTGDVVAYRAVAEDPAGRPVADLPVTWSVTLEAAGFDQTGTSAPAQVREGRFVADVPGLYTVVASAGPLAARVSLQAEAREVVRELEVVGHGLTPWYRTTDLWVFQGPDGRDYALTGSKLADGRAFLFDVTDPANLVKVDSIQVDARTVNDVKVSPDGRWAALSREGASNRRNGVVLLDLSALPVLRVASTFDEGLTGGVHNMFATDDHLFAVSGGDKYLILDVTDLERPVAVGEYDHPDSRIHDVWVHDGLAYSAEWGTGVVIVDVGDGRWGGSVESPALVATYALPTGSTHAIFPYRSESAGRTYLFVGDEIMSRRGLAWGGYPRSMGSYAERYDPQSGTGGIPLATTGYIQVVDVTDPESPEMVARYEVSEFGTHNFWVEDDVLYVAYYEGGVRAVDVSGELRGNLYTQGREMAVFRSAHPQGFTANATMVWGAQPFKGHVFFSDTNSGLWAVRLRPGERPVS